MIHKYSEMETALSTGVRGGEGNVHFRHLFRAAEIKDRAAMLSVVTLEPGCSVGTHPHETNGELYYILEGKAMVEEDGVETELSAGDAEFCADGHSHAIRNHTDTVMRFMAVIVPDR